jgi:hypothetical protein
MLYVYRFSTILILTIILTACSSDDSGGGTENTILTQEELVDMWAVSNIEGIPDSVGGPSGVDASNSTFTFRSDGTYDWYFIFNDDPFFFNLIGTGTYSLNGSELTFEGIVADTILDTLQPKIVTLTVSSDKNTFSFLDADDDRWTYNRL